MPIYMGSRSGGFWKTYNEGATWQNTTDFLYASGVNTIAVSQTNPDTVLINGLLYHFLNLLRQIGLLSLLLTLLG